MRSVALGALVRAASRRDAAAGVAASRPRTPTPRVRRRAAELAPALGAGRAAAALLALLADDDPLVGRGRRVRAR